MNRVIRIDPDPLEWSLGLTPEQRLRQADAAFRLYHELHRPYARAFHRGFDSLEEFFRFALRGIAGRESKHLPESG